MELPDAQRLVIDGAIVQIDDEDEEELEGDTPSNQKETAKIAENTLCNKQDDEKDNSDETQVHGTPRIVSPSNEDGETRREVGTQPQQPSETHPRKCGKAADPLEDAGNSAGQTGENS